MGNVSAYHRGNYNITEFNWFHENTLCLGQAWTMDIKGEDLKKLL